MQDSPVERPTAPLRTVRPATLVPEGVVVSSVEEALEAWEDLGGGAVVVKPQDGRQGKGVSLNLATPEQIREAFACADEYSSRVIVEQFLRGRDYRVLVINGKLIAAADTANALAAIAAARSQGIPPCTVFLALARFDINRDNPGRMNLYRIGAGYVMLDYGHNPAAYESVSQLVGTWRKEGRRVSAVLGLPGDRADWVSREAAQIAARIFDRLILREDRSLRGRQPGEMIRLMRAAVDEVRHDKECIEIPDETEALEEAIRTRQDDEVVVAFLDEIAIAQQVLQRNGAVETTAIG